MNKKLKFAIPFAVLALTCGVAAGAAGCKKHQHDYSGWGHDDDYHWHVCECGEIEEGSKEEHVWAGGECDCGATKEIEDPVVQKKYGTVTGKVKLTKYGSQVTEEAALNKIKVDMGDDKVKVTGSVADGVYTFTASNVVVGKTYDVVISCAGYNSYTPQIELETEGENLALGGETGITLEFKVFNTLFGWDEDLHDYSKLNENYIVFKNHVGNKTLNVLSSESYEDVSATLRIRSGNSTNGEHTQGIVLKFEDGRHVVVRFHNNSNIQYHNQEWASEANGLKPDDSLYGSDAGLSEEWGENKFYYLSDSEMADVTQTDADSGLDLNVILKDGTLYTFFDGKYLAEYDLPTGYAEKTVQVGFFAPDAANNAHFHYGISTEVPETMESTIPVTVNQPEDLAEAQDKCSVTLSGGKESYAFGEEVTLTFNAPNGYKLNELMVGGEDMFSAVKQNTLTIKANKLELPVVATFIKEVPVELNLTIQGNKLGKTAAIAKDTTVTFVDTDYTFIVGDNGAIHNDSVIKGRYTVHVDGYKDKEINFTGENDTITLEYDTFKSLLKWGTANFDHQNDETPIITHPNNCHLISTKQAYSGSVMASVYLSGSYKENDTTKYIADGNQGIMFRFVGTGMSEHGECVFIRMQVKAAEATNKIQFATYGGNWGESGYTIVDATGANWQDLIFFEGANKDADSDKYIAAYKKGELKLSVLRDGATFHVFLGYTDANDDYVETYIGSRTFDNKYINAKCEAGFLQDSTNDAAKSWKVEIEENATLPAVNITNNTATTDAHGTASVSGNYKVGETVTITVNPDENYLLDKLTVKNGENEIALTKTSDTTYTFVATRTKYTFEATFKKIGKIDSVIFNVDQKWGANGLNYTLSRTGYDSYTGTISDNKFTATQVQMGEWTLSTTLYGAPVSFAVNVTSESVDVDFGSAITNSSSAAVAGFKLGEGGISYTNVSGDKGVGIQTNVTGDAWISGKVKLSQTEANKLLTGNGGQAPFAMYVKFSDGTEQHIGLNMSRKDGDVHLCLVDGGPWKEDQNWWEDGHDWNNNCNVKLGTTNRNGKSYNLSKYGEALFGGSGLYYILNYNSTTGYLSVYYATGDNDFILAKEMAHFDKKGATITEFGISRGIGWGDLDLTYEISEFNYSATLKEAWKTLSVSPTCENCEVTCDTSNATTLSGTVEFTVTPQAGYKLTSFMVNGNQLVNSVSGGKVSYNVTGGISSVIAICVPESSIIDTNSADYNLDAEVGGKKVVAYQTFTGDDTNGVYTYSNDVLGLLNLSAAINNKDGAATDFGTERWKVYASGIDNGTAPCIKGEFDMTVKLVKGVQQIRLFVGGWWKDNHGGTFTLTTKTGDYVYGKVTYCSPKDQTNDIIVFDVDTASFKADQVVECVLHFNGLGYNQLPFAGVQVLGDVSGFVKENKCTSTVSIYEADGKTLATIEGDVTLTMTRESDGKVYTTKLTKDDNGTYALSGEFEAGHYALTIDAAGYTCTSAGYDGIGTGNGSATDKLWIDSSGGGLWFITFTANA